MIDQDLSHHLRTQPTKLLPILNSGDVLIDEPQIRLVDERRRLERVGDPLALQLPLSETLQLLVDEVEEFLDVDRLPGLRLLENLCERLSRRHG